MEAPLISVVTPSFNQARFLREALESVLMQDYAAIESIVVDAASTDGSVDILQSYGERIRWVSERDNGQADALNKGFAMARGEIVAWINSDDLMLPGAARLAAEALQQDSRLGFVYGNGWILDERGERLERFPHTEAYNPWRLIHFGDTILQQSVFMRKSALEAIGGLDASLRWGLDWDLFIRLEKHFPARMIEADMGAIRVYGETKTATGGLARLRELGGVIQRHAGTRWTPSFAGFALDAAYAGGKSFAERLPDAVQGPVRRALDAAHDFASRRVLPAMEECQGWLHDGWAMPALHVLFPATLRGQSAELRGKVLGKRQVLQVFWNGKETALRAIEEGPFTLILDVPSRMREEPLHLEIRADTVVASRRRYHGGVQPLCYQLDSITLSGAEGDLRYLPPRRLIPVPEAPDETLG